MTRDEFKKVLRDLLEKHEKREREHRYVSLDKYAREYISAFVPDEASEEQITATIEAFKAGALAGFETLYNAFDPLQKLKKGSDEYEATNHRIHRHLRLWQEDMSKIAATLLAKRMEQETDATVHVVHISDALAKIIEHLVGDKDDDDTDANGDKQRDEPQPQHDHLKPSEPEHG